MFYTGLGRSAVYNISNLNRGENAILIQNLCRDLFGIRVIVKRLKPEFCVKTASLIIFGSSMYELAVKTTHVVGLILLSGTIIFIIGE